MPLGKYVPKSLDSCVPNMTLLLKHISHTPGVALTTLADALSCWHMGAMFRDKVNQLIKDRGLILVLIDI